MMATMITSEELECRDILNDVGIFFSEDSDLLDTDFNCDDDFKAIVSSPSPTVVTPTKSAVPVSPTTTPEVPTSTSLQPLGLLAPNPLSTPQFSFPVLPVMPSIMPTETAVMPAASTIQRAVSDVSMTSTTRTMPTTTTTTTNSRKRPLQGMPQADLDLDEQSRRKRNREHAKKSRQRKKALTDDLRSTVEALRQETEKLRQELYAAIGEEEVTAILEERKRKEQEDFITALQQPKNRVVDAPTLKFLKGLSKKLPKQG